MKNTAIIASIVLLVGAALGAYLMGTWKDKKTEEAVAAAVAIEQGNRAALEAELASTKLAKEMADFRLRLGTLAIETSRLNYGTAKDLAVEFFTDLEAFSEKTKGTEYETAVATILGSRDQIVSDVSVGSPTAAESLQRLYLEVK